MGNFLGNVFDPEATTQAFGDIFAGNGNLATNVADVTDVGGFFHTTAQEQDKKDDKANAYQQYMNEQKAFMEQILGMNPAAMIQPLSSLISDALGFMPSIANMSTQLGKNVNPQQYSVELANQAKYLPLFQQMMQDSLAAGRTGDIADVLRLAPAVAAAQKAGERKDVSAIRDLLGKQIFTNLAAGERLTPEQQRMTEQATRSSMMARGSQGMGGGDIMRESVAKALEGQGLASSRRAEARSMLTSEDARAADPFSVVLNSGASTVMGMNNYNAGLRQPTTPSLVGPLVQAGQQQNQAQYQAALQNQQMALMTQYMPQLMGMGG